MEKKSGRKKKEAREMLAEKVNELYLQLEQYKELHRSKQELKEIKRLELSLETSLDTLYRLSELLEMPVSVDHVLEKAKGQLSYSGAAKALFSDYEVIYYVDVQNDHYVGYSTLGTLAQMKLESEGTDFFTDLYRNIREVVYEKDQERVTRALTKENLLPKLENGQVFSVKYRLMVKGEPMRYQSRVAWPEHGKHIIIGICRTDQVNTEETVEEDWDFSNIAKAMSSDFEHIYYIDMKTDSYVHYMTDKSRELRISSEGASFFEEMEMVGGKIIYKKDANRFREIFQKEFLLEELKKWGVISMTYRILVKGKPVYHQLKVLCPEENDYHHIMVCIGNVEQQMQKQLEFLQKKNLTYTKIAETLSKNYFSIYYVDIITGYYMEYSSNSSFWSLEIINSGEDFFGDCKKNIPVQVYPDDVEMVLLAYQKEKILAELKKTDSFELVYRLLLNGVPTYVNTKATRIDGDPSHILVGVNNVDVQVRRQQELERVLRQSRNALEKSQENLRKSQTELEKSQTDKLTFSQIALTLSKDYFSVYYVDLRTEHYIEYNSNDEYEELNTAKEGMDFFSEMRKKMKQTLCKEDQERILSVFTKQFVLEEIGKGHPFTVSYRVMLKDVPVYVSMKADYLDEKKTHILVGISSIDAQMKRELEYAKALKQTRELVDKDPLTGAKSKHAYQMMEEKLNRRIIAKIPVEFAVVICDVNNLKTVNDTLGHKAGDRWIKGASHMICSVFKRSPVFRIGGDEFVVILQGQDYKNREKLLSEIREWSKRNKEKGEVVVAVGISVFCGTEDHVMEAVFQRADEEMYKNKMELKDAGEEIR